MKLRNIAAILAIAATGTAFAATTTETTVTRETPHGTVTKHIVKVKPNHHRAVKHVVVSRAPVRHTRHAVYVNPHHHKVLHPAKKVVVIHNS